MNEAPWKQAEADAEDAKAEAISFALDKLNDVAEIIEVTNRPMLEGCRQMLTAEQKHHEDRGKLLRQPGA